jgi:hypothetical protein
MLGVSPGISGMFRKAVMIVGTDIEKEPELVQVAVFKVAISELSNSMKWLFGVVIDTASSTREILGKAIFAPICPCSRAAVCTYSIRWRSFESDHLEQ